MRAELLAALKALETEVQRLKACSAAVAEIIDDRAVDSARAAIAKAEGPRSSWTVEFRPELGGWEVKEGTGHRGVYGSEGEARAAITKLQT
jgi:hypothetical protein